MIFENDAEHEQGIATTLDDDTEDYGDQRIVDGLLNYVLVSPTGTNVQPHTSSTNTA